jgi:hypothetical protein
LEISDAEFAERYLGEMTRYFYEHARDALAREASFRMMGVGSGLDPIACSDCRNPIDSPQDLRRYYGNSFLHPVCFAKRWGADIADQQILSAILLLRYLVNQ